MTKTKETPKVAVKAPASRSQKAPNIVTYVMKQQGSYDIGGEEPAFTRSEKRQGPDGKFATRYLIDVPEGILDHLFNEDGTSRYVAGKA